MSSLLDMLRSAFDARTRDQRDNLALMRFRGVSEAFDQVCMDIPLVWIQGGANNQAQQRAMVFFVLAVARMRLAEQLHVALHDDMQSATRSRPSQARLDLEDLTSQIDVLTLAASLELTQAGSTTGIWETTHHLREAITPPPPSERGEDTIAHAHAMFNGGLVILTHLQAQLKVCESSAAAAALVTARTLFTEAQHAFDTMRPLVDQLPTRPTLFASCDMALHEEIEAKVGHMIRLLEGATAELMVPQVTQTQFWNDMFGNPRAPALAAGISLGASAVRAAGDRPWERDTWCITSELFQQTNRDNARAQRVLRAMWAADPNPEASWALYQSVQKLECAGAVRTGTSYFNACPWTPIWRAERTVRVGNKVVRAGDQFCLHIESELDGGFNREVIVADFQPTDALDYCDMEGTAHHDE